MSVRRFRPGSISDDPRRRMIATACYLIDTLCLRVGDEKEADEADTVGATTLRPEHVTLHEDGSAEFGFLGKDSVHWHKTLDCLYPVYDSLAELIAARAPLAYRRRREQQRRRTAAAALSGCHQRQRERLFLTHPAGPLGQKVPHLPRDQSRGA